MADLDAAPDARKRSFEDARLETVECGFLLACYQTLLLAMRDRRLQYKHRAVLAVLIEHMNSKTCMTWVGRDRIAGELGLAVATVANALTDLASMGYILAENRRTPETSNRSLRHYTIAKLSREELEQRLNDAIAAIKSNGPRKVAEQIKVTADGDFKSHRPQGFSVQPDQKSPPAVDESHRRPWTVTNNKKLISEVSVANSRSQPPHRAALIIDEVKPAKRKARATGKRPWDWVHDGEKRELLERCKSFAAERGWSEEFLAGRLEAFALRQSSSRFASADWWAELKLWLSSPAHQPRATRFTSSSTDRTEGTRQRLGWGSE